MALGRLRDYRDGDLFYGEKVIDWFRVAGVLAEHGLLASLKHGNTCFGERHLPNEVQMRTDGNALVRVKVRPREKELAVRTARLVRSELNRLGMEIRQVVRRSLRGRMGEEHDMVIEVVRTEDELAPIKKISGELKLRRLWSAKGLSDVRAAIQKESATACEWWQAELATGRWEGRLLVLARWQSLAAEGDPEIKIDYVPRDCAPRGFSGWIGSKKTFKALPAPLRPLQSSTSSSPMPKAAAKSPAAPTRAVRPFPTLTFRRDAETMNLRVAPVLDIYADLKQPTTNIGRDMKNWKTKFPTYEHSIITAPRGGQGQKRGGRQEWYATEAALFHMHTKLLKWE